MASVSEEDVRRLMAIVRDSQSGRTMDERWSAITHGLRRLIPFDAFFAGTFSKALLTVPDQRELISYDYDLDGQAGHQFAIDYDRKGIEEYGHYFIERDAIGARVLERGPRPTLLSEVLPARLWGKDEATSDFYHPHAFRYALSAVPPLTERVSLTFTLFRSQRRGDYSPRDVEVLELLIPHLAEATRAVLLNNALAQYNKNNDESKGLIILRRDGELDNADAAGRAILARIEGTRGPGGLILEGLRRLKSAAGSRARIAGASRVTGEQLLLEFTPLEQRGQIAVHLCATRSSGQRALAAELLSPREFEAATLAARGLSNKMIADKMALSIDTVKEYMSRAFHKTKTHNRAGLTAFLLGRAGGEG